MSLRSLLLNYITTHQTGNPAEGISGINWLSQYKCNVLAIFYEPHLTPIVVVLKSADAKEVETGAELDHNKKNWPQCREIRKEEPGETRFDNAPPQEDVRDNQPSRGLAIIRTSWPPSLLLVRNKLRRRLKL